MIARRILMLSPAAMMVASRPAAAALYRINPATGSIEFSVSHMGLFSSRG